MKRALRVIVILCLPAEVLWGQKACPWLSTGTAAVLMGGAADSDVNISGAKEGVCIYTYGIGREALILRIEVGSVAKPVCAATESDRLMGVGSEAWWCKYDVDNEHRSQIRSHVRSLPFVVTLGWSGTKSATFEAKERTLLEQAAEDVAGSLF